MHHTCTRNDAYCTMACRPRTVDLMPANLALVQARNHARLSQGDLARRVREAGRKIGASNSCNRTTVGRWEAGLVTPQPRMMAALEHALGLPADRLGFGEITVTAELVTLPEPGDAAAADEAAMAAWRKADLRVGGAHLYASVLAYLTDRVAPRLVMPGAGRAAYTSGAAVSEMCGWMAHDAGYDDLARQHFGSALNLARVSGDRQVTAHILASLGHVAHFTGDADGALRAASAGLDLLASGPRDPDRLAYLYAIQARGYAARHQPDGAVRCLLAAEHALVVPRSEPASEWVNPFDEGAYANEAARVMRQLGHHGAAVRHARRVMELRPPSGPGPARSACSSRLTCWQRRETLSRPPLSARRSWRRRTACPPTRSSAGSSPCSGSLSRTGRAPPWPGSCPCSPRPCWKGPGCRSGCPRDPTAAL